MFFFTESNFKDNPALSMLNDSDEEVHYGYIYNIIIYIAGVWKYWNVLLVPGQAIWKKLLVRTKS